VSFFVELNNENYRWSGEVVSFDSRNIIRFWLSCVGVVRHFDRLLVVHSRRFGSGLTRLQIIHHSLHSLFWQWFGEDSTSSEVFYRILELKLYAWSETWERLDIYCLWSYFDSSVRLEMKGKLYLIISFKQLF